MSGVARILLVDDDREVRLTCRALLEHAGFFVEAASNGPAGLRAARARPPDLVLLDLAMPGMDGGEVLRQLRLDGRTRALPVVALTGVPQWLTDHRDTSAFDAVLLKPVTGERLVAAVREVLHNPPTS